MIARGKGRGWVVILALLLWMVPAKAAGYLVASASNNSVGVYPAAPQATFYADYIDPDDNYFDDWSVGGSWLFNPLTSPCPPAYLAPAASDPACVGPESYAYSDFIGGAGECLEGNNPDQQPYQCDPWISITGVLTLPDFGAAPPAQFTATIPVTFTAGGVVNFSGWGNATVTLNEASDSYVFSSATYTLDPAPEPEAFSLMGLGLGAIFLAGRARASACRRLAARA